MAAFSRYVGIDYSGAEMPESSLRGLRVYYAVGESVASEVPPPPSPRKYWTRRGIAHWLAERLVEDVQTIVGIDHGFSFPQRYFEVHRLPPDWPTFLEDFHRHWPTDAEHTYVDFVRDGLAGNSAARTGNAAQCAPTPRTVPTGKCPLRRSTRPLDFADPCPPHHDAGSMHPHPAAR